MALVTVNQLVYEASKKGYAVPAMNIYNMESAIPVIQAAEKLRSPVILQVFRRLVQSDISLGITSYIKEAAAVSNVPIALHLDHGVKKEEVFKALRLGFTGVMIDGSQQGFEENVRICKSVSEIAHSLGVSVEGELGFIGTTKEKQNKGAFTNPEQAKLFVESTGIDMLAVCVGSAHGTYKEDPKLDFKRISEIKENTSIPLVLHGGSGIPDTDIRKAIKAGISKINVATDICQAYYRGFRNRDNEGSSFFEKPIDLFFNDSIREIKSFVTEKMALFDSVDKVP